MKKFAGKYRIPSARAPWWDYANDGAYFVTICTAHRECYFGDVVNGMMQFNETGEIANAIWDEIPRQFPYAELGVYQVMPNHVHGIIVINHTKCGDSDEKPDDGNANDDGINDGETNNGKTNDDGTRDGGMRGCRDAINRVSTGINAETNTRNADETTGGITGNHNPMLHDNLSRILRWYKGRVTFECHQTDVKFGWQSRFYDNIIRDTDSFHRITQYIINNPAKWDADKFHPSNR